MTVPVTILSAVAILLSGIPVSAAVSTVMTAKLTARKLNLYLLCLFHIFTTFLFKPYVFHPVG